MQNHSTNHKPSVIFSQLLLNPTRTNMDATLFQPDSIEDDQKMLKMEHNKKSFERKMTKTATQYNKLKRSWYSSEQSIFLMKNSKFDNLELQ